MGSRLLACDLAEQAVGGESTCRSGVILLYLEDLLSEKIALCYGRSLYLMESVQTHGGLF